MKQLVGALLALFLASVTGGQAHAQAGSCRVTNSVCIDAADRVINGVPVSRPCWEYRDTYECVDPGATNYCAGIQSQPNCTMQNVVCDSTAFNGACTLETKTYACSSGYTGPATGVIDLGSTYTIQTENLDLGTCTSPASNPACVQTGPQTCIDGPGYKTIDGVPVYQECWEWSRDYACSVSNAVNYCQPLAGAGCVENTAASTCVETGVDGVCNSTRRNFVCTDKPPVSGTNVVQLDTSYTITKDEQDASACSSAANNPTCSVADSICIEGPETRTINGLPVYKACWKTRLTYTCAALNPTNYCSPLAAAGCTKQGAGVCEETGADGQCNRYKETYTCENNSSVSGANIVNVGTNYTVTKDVIDTTGCDASATNPICREVGRVCAEGPETRIINGAPIYKACWRTQVTYSCSMDNAVNYCTPLIAAGCTRQGVPTCIETAANGDCNRYEETYTCVNNDSVTGDKVVRLNTDYTIKSDTIDESACSTQEASSACGKPPTSVCTQGPETRVINGKAIYKDCWEWQRTYNCAVSNQADFCTPLRILGCTEQGSVCAETGSDGVCNSYTKTFACLNNSGASGQNIVYLDTSYTIKNDYFDVAPCADPASNPACVMKTENCIEPAETRKINGLDVYRSCWKYERSYTCTVAGGANYCTPVAATPGCTRIDTNCIETGTNGACIASESTYQCEDQLSNPLPTNVTYLNNVYTIVKDEIRDQCTAPEANPACTLFNEICAEPGGVRNINGLDVYKPCWRWEREYICQDVSQTVDECTPLENDPACTLARQSCSIDKFTGVPDCGLTTKVFSCQVTPEKDTDVQTCFEQSCVGPMCGKDPDPPDEDFAKSVTIMELQRQAAGYLDKQGRVFSGIPSKCERRLFGLSNCCKEKVQAAGGSNRQVFAANAITFVGETVAAVGSAYVWDGLFGTAANLYPEISGFAGGVISKGYVAQAAPTTSMSFYGITANVQTFANAGTFAESFTVSWSFDPYSFAFAVAAQVLTNMASCDQEEQTLALRKGQRLCTLVGGYKTGRIWRRSYEGYCCYNSRLARIVQEQGRKLLGRSYGSPQNPDCTGLTPEELQQLDFSRIDLSEFIADVQSKALDTTAALNRFATRGATITASTANNRNDSIAQYMPASPGSTGAVDRTPGAPNSPPAQTPKTESELRGCALPTVIDEQVGACRHPSGYYYEPRSMALMPCAQGYVKDSLVPACVNPATGQYYYMKTIEEPWKAVIAMPCPVGRYLEPITNLCKEPTAP